MSSGNSNAPEEASLPQEQAAVAAQVAADATLAEQLANSEQDVYEQNQHAIMSIEEQVRQSQQLVGEKLTLQEGLVAEFDPETSPEYHKKAVELSATYSHIRKIRGDGNCFYRAVLTAILERVLEHREELEPLITTVTGWRARMLAFGFPALTTGDFCDAMETLLVSIRDGFKNIDLLMDDLRQDNIANYYVAFMRLIASGYLNEHADEYAPFIVDRTLEDYCKWDVEPMWKDADHISIQGLVNALETKLRIVYLDRREAANATGYYDFPEGFEGEPKLVLLFRPGHYDLLYKKADSGSS